METESGLQNEGMKNAYAPELLDVHGFRFLTRQDAEKAEIDAGKIAYIESHVGNSSAAALTAVYEKSISNKIFSTPVGWCFLQNLRGELLRLGVDEATLSPIPVTASFTRQPAPLAQAQPETAPEEKKPRRNRERAERGEPKKNTPLLIMSAMFNLVLIGVVIAMFMILSYGETTNMLNYKQQYTNEFAIMKQELQQEIQDKKKELLERERAVSERERAAGMAQTQTQQETENEND